jgi:diaminopimelate decarboxylase
MPQPLIDFATARAIAATHGTPVYVYHEATLLAQAEQALAFPAPYGLTVRYAIKAAPTRALLRLFAGEGLHFDASSGYEAERLLRAGIAGERISLSTQELPENFAALVERGVSVNACSLRQLELYGAAFPGARVGLRFNPGLGSGGTNRTNVGGPASSFGIWHEQVEQARERADAHRLDVFRIHTHIGSGSDPEVWQRAARLSLRMAAAFPSVTHFNLGGGYKVARMDGEVATDLQRIGAPLARMLETFAAEHGRRLHFEIEPGTFLVANAGALLARVQDVVHTGADGYTFVKLDCGMTEILRPSLYGAQHPVTILTDAPGDAQMDAIVVGHCCESGDILTPAPGDPEALAPRAMAPAAPGDLALIGGAGAYCSAMSAKNYNSFPEAPEVLLRRDGSVELIRRRQTLDQILANET